MSEQLVEICACRPWNASGIKVEAGQQYTFRIAELTENWIDGPIRSTPENGWEGGFYNLIGHIVGFLKRSDKANWYALVGAIGKNDEETFAAFTPKPSPLETPTKTMDATSNSAWLPVTMSRDGELYFFANDKNGRYFNNTGTMRLVIVRTR